MSGATTDQPNVSVVDSPNGFSGTNGTAGTGDGSNVGNVNNVDNGNMYDIDKLTKSTYFQAKFDEDAFKQDAFDASQFVNKCLAGASSEGGPGILEDLRTDLTKYGSKLHTDLIDLLNREYNGFIGLSSNLVGINTRIHDINEQLTEFRERMHAAHIEINTALGEVEEKMEGKKKSAVRTKFLDLLQQVHLSYRRINEQLNTLNPSPVGVVEDARAPSDPSQVYAQLCDAYERGGDGVDGIASCVDDVALAEQIARQIALLNIWTEMGQKFSLVQQLIPQLRRMEEEFLSKLELLLLQAVKLQHSQSISHCLRAYVYVDQCDVAIYVLRSKLVKPVVHSIFSKEQIRKVCIAKEEKLGTLYTKLLFFIEHDLGATLECVNRLCKPELDILGDSVWKEVEKSLSSHGSQLFAPGIPDNFHSNYTQSMTFLRKLESFVSPQVIHKFRQHPSTLSFMKKWNLPVYYQLRLQAAVGVFEQTLSTPPTVIKTTQDSQKQDVVLADHENKELQFFVSATPVLWSQMNFCWANNVWVEPMTERFLRLTLQLFSRYMQWIEGGLFSKSGTNPNRNVPEAQTQSQEGHQKAENSESSNQNNSQNSQDEAWSPATVKLHVLVLLYVDAGTLASAISDRLMQTILNRVGVNNVSRTEGLQLIKNSFETGLQRLDKLRPALADSVATAVNRKCSTILQAIPRIKSSYRMNVNAEPDKPSPYVEDVMTCVTTALFNSDFQSVLTRSDTDSLCAGVAVKVLNRYISLVSELLDVVDKTEQSLKRLQSKAAKKGREAAFFDSQKIRIQLVLDTKAFRDFFTERSEKNQTFNKVISQLDQLSLGAS